MYIATPSYHRPLSWVRKNSKNLRRGQRRKLWENPRKGIPLPRMDQCSIDVRSTERNNMTDITVYGYENIRTETRSVLFKRRDQEPDTGPDQDSRPVFCWVGKVKLIMTDPDIPGSR